LLKKLLSFLPKIVPTLPNKTNTMATYNDLQQGSYYVIQEIENATLELVYVPLITDKCVLVEYQDEEQTLSWYRKTEELFEVVEQLTEEQAVIYESLFEDLEEEEDDFFWDDDDDDDEFWGGEDDDDDDEDEGNIKVINN